MPQQSNATPSTDLANRLAKLIEDFRVLADPRRPVRVRFVHYGMDAAERGVPRYLRRSPASSQRQCSEFIAAWPDGMTPSAEAPRRAVYLFGGADDMQALKGTASEAAAVVGAAGIPGDLDEHLTGWRYEREGLWWALLFAAAWTWKLPGLQATRRIWLNDKASQSAEWSSEGLAATREFFGDAWLGGVISDSWIQNPPDAHFGDIQDAARASWLLAQQLASSIRPAVDNGGENTAGIAGYVPADTLKLEEGITQNRLSEAARVGKVSTKSAPPGTKDSQGRTVRMLYCRAEAIEHCKPGRLGKKRAGR